MKAHIILELGFALPNLHINLIEASSIVFYYQCLKTVTPKSFFLNPDHDGKLSAGDAERIGPCAHAQLTRIHFLISIYLFFRVCSKEKSVECIIFLGIITVQHLKAQFKEEQKLAIKTNLP